MTLIVRIAVLAFLPALLTAAPLTAQEPRLLRQPPSLAWRGCPTPSEPTPRATVQQRQEAERLAASATQAAILGDTRTALDLLVRAARLEPASSDIAYHLGRAYEESDMPAEAVNEYCRYTRLAPDAPDLADVTQRIAQLAASANLTTGPPADAARAFEAGIVYYDTGRLTEAEDAFTRAWQYGRGWGAPLYNRAVVRLALQRRDDAVADLRDYLGTGDGTPHAAEVVDLLAMLPGAAQPQQSGTGALLAGILVPGLGHFTTGRPGRGVVVLGLAAAAVGTGLLVERVSVQCLSPPVDGRCPPDLVVGETSERPLLLPAVAVAAAVGILGALDAYRGVQRRGSAARSAGSGGTATGLSLRPDIEVRRDRASVELIRLRFR